MKQLFILNERKGVITSPSLLFEKIKKININFGQENFLIFYFDTRNRIIKSEVLFKGGLNQTLIDPKIIFRFALKEKNCNSFIIAHNHPSGDLSPSDEDTNIFEKIVEIGKLITLHCLDSIIFNQKEFYSMKTQEAI